MDFTSYIDDKSAGVESADKGSVIALAVEAGKGFLCTGCWTSDCYSQEEQDLRLAWCVERTKKYPDIFAGPMEFLDPA